MRTRLRLVLLLSVFFASGLVFFIATSPQAFASSYASPVISTAPLSIAQMPSQRNDYIRGYRQGYNDAVYDCTRYLNRVQAKSLNDYNRGYTDGYNYARAHDRACTKR